MTDSTKHADAFSVIKKYLDALVSHDGDSVPLAPECWRSEQGKCSAKPAKGIRKGLEDPIMNGILNYRDLRTWVDGDDLIAFFLLDTTGSTVRIAERFRVIDGLIYEIEALFCADSAGNQGRWPNDPSQVWTRENSPDYISPMNLS